MRLPCLLLIALTLAGCSGIETETLREKSLLLQGMRSYQWAFRADELAAAQSDEDSSPQLQLHAHFQATVDRIMAAKGYQKQVSGADMELDYRVLLMQEKREIYQADEIAAA